MKMHLLTLAVMSPSLLAAGEAEVLSRSLPPTANTVTVVRVADIFQTKRAQDEGWADQQEQRFLKGAAVIPTWVDTLVIGSLVHPAVPKEVWSAAVVRQPQAVTLEAIAEHEQSSIEELAGVPAIRSRRDRFIIQPKPGLLAVYRPAQRLEASRWIRSLATESPSSLSPYLSHAVSQEGHIVMAIDLADLLDAKRVEQHLMQDQRFATHGSLVKRLVPLIAGLRGITFQASLLEKTEAVVTIEFSNDVGPSGPTAKTLFVSLLDDLGASIDEFAFSKAQTLGQSVTLSCQLSDESLRRILSLVVTPSAPDENSPQTVPDDKTQPSPRTAKLRTAADPDRRYFDAVNKMLDDLQKANRRAKDYERTAGWHDSFANRILELPSAGVDRRLLTYGQCIASKFRALAASLRGQAVAVNAQEKTLTYDVDYTPGWASVNVWGGVGYGESAYNVTSNLQQVREQQAAAVVAGAKDREQIWLFIEDERSQMTLQIDAESNSSNQ